jgi:hypothetical protein
VILPHTRFGLQGSWSRGGGTVFEIGIHCGIRRIFKAIAGKRRRHELLFLILVGMLALLAATAAAQPANETLEQPVPRLPIIARVGIELDQLTEINQQNENFGAVASLWMRWYDPELVFDPEECNCNFKIYRSIDAFVAAEGPLMPEFILFNQQERRWTQNMLMVIQPDGTATYYERFWSLFQAPDFNFRRYPFDKQTFYIHVDSLYAEDIIKYEPWDEKTAIGTQLGEEEWYITEYQSIISSTQITNINSRYSLEFQAQRHLPYILSGSSLPSPSLSSLPGSRSSSVITQIGPRSPVATS